MSERSLLLLLEDISFSIDHIFDYTAGLNFEHYETDQKTKDAVERNFSIIGEALARLDNGLTEQYPQINWRQVKGFQKYYYSRLLRN